MSRTRLIYHSFFTDEDLAEIPPLSRLAAIGLLTVADRDGRVEYRPKRLRIQLFPYDDGVEIDAIVADLVTAKWIVVYAADGRQVIQIRNFGKFQRPHPREAKGNLPPPPGPQGTPKARPRRTQGEPRIAKERPQANQGYAIPVVSVSVSDSVSVSVSDSVSNSVSVSDGGRPELSTGGGEKALIENFPKPEAKPPATASPMARIKALAERKRVRLVAGERT